MSWLVTSKQFEDDSWTHGWSTSNGPDFSGDPGTADHVTCVGQLVVAAQLKDAAWVNQVHQGNVVYANSPGLIGNADAAWTDQPGLGVVGRSADCPLILVRGRRPDTTRLWGFAHASWRSTIAGITGNLLQEMIDAELEVTTCEAVICPSAGPCCYEVGPEVRDAALKTLGMAAENIFVFRNERLYLDLWSANVFQLAALGVQRSAIHVDGTCTICCDGTYHSYRRDADQAGRIAAIIGCRD